MRSSGLGIQEDGTMKPKPKRNQTYYLMKYKCNKNVGLDAANRI